MYFKFGMVHVFVKNARYFITSTRFDESSEDIHLYTNISSSQMYRQYSLISKTGEGVRLEPEEGEVKVENLL